MFSNNYLVIGILSLVIAFVRTQDGDLASNHLYTMASKFIRPKLGDLYLMQDKLQPLQESIRYLPQYLQHRLQQSQPQDKVKIQLYYESHCPDCRSFDREQFVPTVDKLSKYLDIYVYPYGNAETIIFPDGQFKIICQHGPAECYGNMLHACAIDLLSNFTQAIDYNGCMMGDKQAKKGSDDEAADKCGELMNINSEPIKYCAKSSRGRMLLKSYGEQSKKVGFKYVPYVLINGQVTNEDNFMQRVCAAFENPPPECNESN